MVHDACAKWYGLGHLSSHNLLEQLAVPILLLVRLTASCGSYPIIPSSYTMRQHKLLLHVFHRLLTCDMRHAGIHMGG